MESLDISEKRGLDRRQAQARDGLTVPGLRLPATTVSLYNITRH